MSLGALSLAGLVKVTVISYAAHGSKPLDTFLSPILLSMSNVIYMKLAQNLARHGGTPGPRCTVGTDNMVSYGPLT